MIEAAETCGGVMKAEEYPRVELTGLPKLDRFFPDCALGLVELFASHAYGFRDLKKIWFGNTFAYERPESGRWLSASRVELAGHFSLAGDVRGRAFRWLEKYYGIRVDAQRFHDFDALLHAVHGTLSSGLPALSMFDMSFLQREGRANGKVQPHLVGIAACDVAAGTLVLVDQVRGKVPVPLARYEESLRRFAAEDHEFCLLHCERIRSEAPLPLDRAEILSELRAALTNLHSAEATLGLNALSSLELDVSRALEAEKQPFAIPGQWVFSHDRSALKKALPYWEEAQVGSSALRSRLAGLLGDAFALWFQMDMTIERALYERDVAHMHAALRELREASRVEGELARVLGQIHEHSTASVVGAPA
jgi:hypothetical protein